MGEYFRPWKRKIGVVTLITTCCLMGAWVRSRVVCDSFAFAVAPHRYFCFGVIPEAFGLFFIQSSDPELAKTAPQWSSDPIDLSAPSIYDDPDTDWVWKQRPFAIGVSRAQEDDLHVAVILFPQWSLIIPLTALSIWLLLSKVRQAKLKSAEKPRTIESETAA